MDHGCHRAGKIPESVREGIVAFGNRIAAPLKQAFSRACDTVLGQRGESFEGTPAATPQDISNFITHAAFCRLRGAPPPRALERPGYGGTAWFADPGIARKMASRHEFRADPDAFGQVLDTLPESWYTECRYRVGSWPIGNANGPLGELYIAQGRRPDCQGTKNLVVTISGRVVFIALFHRRRCATLFKTGFLASDPTLSAEPARARMAKRAIRHGLGLAAAKDPYLGLDFVGTISPEAARLGCSLFRRLRQEEMTRLRALGPDVFSALYRRVCTYPYSRFSQSQVAAPAEMLLPLAREARNLVVQGTGKLTGMIWMTRWHKRGGR